MIEIRRTGPETRGWGLGIATVTLLAACASGPPPPSSLDTKNTECAHCRMVVSDQHFAAQIVAPGEEPRFFDDIGCLRDFLKAAPTRAHGAIAYVADHRTAEWVPAGEAVYTRAQGVDTPMNSGLLAHASATSRDADAAARTGQPVPISDVFGPAGPPGGR